MLLSGWSFASARQRAHAPRAIHRNQYKISKKSCVGINMVSSDFRLFTDFNLPIAGKTFPVAGKVTSLSGCQGCRPCENNCTEIVHLNFICSASKMSRRKKNINSSRQKRQKQTFTDTDRKNLAAKKRKKKCVSAETCLVRKRKYFRHSEAGFRSLDVLYSRWKSEISC